MWNKKRVYSYTISTSTFISLVISRVRGYYFSFQQVDINSLIPLSVISIDALSS